MTPHDLAAWAERAKPEEQRAVMEAAGEILFVQKPLMATGGADYEALDKSLSCRSAWRSLRNRFLAMLDAEAYESAALMLVPEGCSHWNVGGRHQDYGAQVVIGIQEYFGEASTPALALIAAIARAQ